MGILDNLGLTSQATALEGQYGLPAGLLSAQVQQEGGVNADGSAITNASGHTGLAQVSASTAAQPGYNTDPLLDPTNASDSLTFMAQYDAGRAKAAGSLDAGLLGYSGGAYSASSLLGSSATLGTPLLGADGNAGDSLFTGTGSTTDSSGNLVVTPSVSDATAAAGGLQVDTGAAGSAAKSLAQSASAATSAASGLDAFLLWIENQVVRVAVICLGVTIIVLALYLFATDQSPSKGLQTIRVSVTKAARGTRTAAA